jgi:WD40 repeat protein
MGKDTRVPQTGLSLCPALAMVDRTELTPGSALAVSPDGQFQLTYFHTPRGARLALLNRDTKEGRQMDLTAPEIRPGITWRIQEALFSPDSRWLAVRSVGRIWVLDAAQGQVLFTVGVDAAKQLYPGKISWATGKLAVTFWPPESYLADANSKAAVDLRIYEVPGGEVSRTMPLNVHTSNEWLEARLSPDATRLAVLEGARNWPGKARLTLLAPDGGKIVWARSIAVDDVVWSADSQRLFTLGKELSEWDAQTGKSLRSLSVGIDPGEYQRLRMNEAGQMAAGTFIRDNSFQHAAGLVLWRIEPRQQVCEIEIDPGNSIDAWLTARGELLALEEDYEIRPPLRLLKSAHLVTYKLTKVPDAESPAKQ